MQQRISLVTLGVADLQRAHDFYAGLGWRAANDWRAQEVVFFQCGGMVFGLWNRESLAADSGTEPHSPGAVTLAHNVESPAAVDELLEAARAAGATVVRVGSATAWGGYSAAFLDPDGHPWEVAHNPGFRLAPDGTITLPT